MSRLSRSADFDARSVFDGNVVDVKIADIRGARVGLSHGHVDVVVDVVTKVNDLDVVHVLEHDNRIGQAPLMHDIVYSLLLAIQPELLAITLANVDNDGTHHRYVDVAEGTHRQRAHHQVF